MSATDTILESAAPDNEAAWAYNSLDYSAPTAEQDPLIDFSSPRGVADLDGTSKPTRKEKAKIFAGARQELAIQSMEEEGIPVLSSSAPWTSEQKAAAVARGCHPSATVHYDFIREEMAAHGNTPSCKSLRPRILAVRRSRAQRTKYEVTHMVRLTYLVTEKASACHAHGCD